MKLTALFSRRDINGFWALFADNLANLVIITSVCTYVLKVPESVVLGRIVPGLGVALLFGLGMYARMALKLAETEGRDDVTALPYGISTPVLFVYLFGVMLPVFLAARSAGLDPEASGVRAWQVAVGAAFIGGVIEGLGAFLGPWLKKITPRAGMLGTLAGIALVFIATVPLAEIMEHPLIGIPSLAVVVIGLVAAYRLPWGLPAGLMAIIVGVVAALLTGEITPSTAPFKAIGIFAPWPVVGDVFSGVRLLFVEHIEILAVLLPIEIYNFIETMNNVESAEAAGDSYPVARCQVIDGLGTIIGALFGSPFPTTVYIGHPAYKRLGSRSGYALMVGAVMFVISLFGLMQVFRAWIPVAAVAPILVFVGITITAQAFTATPRAHAVAVGLAMVPHIATLVVLRIGGTVRTLSGWLAETHRLALKPLDLASLPPVLVQRLRDQAYIHLQGQQILSQGAIITGLLWGAIVALLIDRRSLSAAAFCVVAALLTLGGLIHIPGGIGLHWNHPLVYGYLVFAVLCFGTRYLKPGQAHD